MKDKSKKHDHKGTKLLKLSIFFTMMLAPILAIAFKCAYVTFNKNAYQSYSDEYIQESQVVNNTSLFIPNENYIAVYTPDETTTTYGAWITYNTISIDWTDYGFDNHDYNQFRLFKDGMIQIKDINNTQYYKTNVWGNSLKTFNFNLKSINTESYQNGFVRYYLLTYNTQKLDKAFYYAIDEMQESTLFNWTENTAIYTPIQAMTSGLGITTDAIAILLTYWMYITLIYIVFDIVIELFTYLTHTLMGQPM